MLILYDLNKTKIAGLKNYKDLRIERELSGDEVLFFSYPQIDSKYGSIKEETYVRTKKNEYVIKEINIKDDWTEFVAKVNVEDLKGKAVNSFETVEQTCTNAVNLALAGTGWTIGLCDVTKKRTVRKTNCSSYDILQEIKKVYLCDFKFDAINKKVYIYQSMGTDKGSYFSDKLNLKKLEIQSNSYDFCTRIIPIGKDGLKINNINSGKEYVENYQYSNKVITVFWEDNRYTLVENLKEDATAKLNELSKPIRAYSAEIFDLVNLNDKYKNILDYDLGDTITLLSKDKKVKEKQRIVKIVEYPDEPERNSCEIANRTLSFEDIQADTLEAAETINSVTTSDGMIDNSKVDFNPLRLEVVSLISQKADIGELNAAIARIGTLEATTATITQLNAAVARIGILEAGSATVTQLNAANAKIATLETRAGTIDTLLAGNLTAANMQANLITAGTTLIADGSIASAKIISLSADKINAGTMNTNLVTIQSSSGNMLISDNTIQIKDSTRVRVQIGKDASSDYNMYVWDSSGNLMFDATGLKASGIKTKIIRDDMVSDTANINATKIEKESLVTRINGATTLLLASKVKLDTENQTLEVAFNSLKSTVTTTANTVTSQGTSISTIQGQIQAKIWQQDITSATNSLDTRITATETSITALNNAISLKVSTSDFTTYQGTVTSSLNGKANQSALNTTNGNITTLTTRVSTAKSSISVLQNQISLKVEQSDITTAINNIESGGINLLVQKNIVRGKYLNNTGNTVNEVNWFYTDFIPVSGIQNLTTSGYSNLGSAPSTCYYDSSKNFVKGINNNGQSKAKLITIDSGISYIRFSGLIADLGTLKIEKGTKATSYSPAPEDVTNYTDTQVSTAKAEIKVTTDGISSTVSSVQSSVTSLGSRVTSAESSITSLNNSITLKVNTSDFNSYKTTNDNAVSSLTSRISSAELKITDSAIVSTVRSSTAYTNDLAAKANQSALNATNTRVTNTESSITQLSTQIQSKVSTGDFGTLITQNVSSVKVAVGQIGGNNLIKNGGFLFGTTNFSSISGAVLDAVGGYEATTSNSFCRVTCKAQWAGISSIIGKLKHGVKYTLSYTCWVSVNTSTMRLQGYLMNGTSTVVGTMSPVLTLDDGVYRGKFTFTADESINNYTFRFQQIAATTATSIFGLGDLKLEEGENATAWSANNNESSNVSVDISDSGLKVRNGAISILNNAGTQVLSGDTSGNLTIRGDFTTYDDTTGNMAMKLSKRSAFFYDFDSNNVCGEIFAGKTVGSNPVRGMVFGAYRNKFLYIACQDSNNNMAPVITVDNGAFGSAGTVSINSGKQINTQNLYVSGSKNCIQDTRNYGNRLLYAYETTENYLGDLGFGKINEDEECVISTDEIFGECVNVNIEYHVFTQVYHGLITDIERYPNYFIVRGKIGTEFSWELKAKRSGFEHVRLEEKYIEENVVESIEDELKSLASSDIDEELYGDLADELLEV